VTDDPGYSHDQLNAKVWDVMKALMEPDGNRIDAELCLDALAFVASVILDMDPHVAAPSHLRRAAEQHGAVILRYLKFLRAHYERTGIHFGDQIGGGPHETVDLPPGHKLH
jgi:hypothetical protein